MRKVAGGEASAVPNSTFIGHSARQASTNPMILKQGEFEESGPMPGYKEIAQLADDHPLPEAEGAEGGSCDCPKACMLDKLYAADMILGPHDLDLEGGMNSPEDAALAEELEEMMAGSEESDFRAGPLQAVEDDLNHVEVTPRDDPGRIRREGPI